jgi:transglutaminase-like putative cysteine protease
MRIDEPIDFQRYGSRVAMLLAATTATRYTAESDAAQAFGGFVFWSFAFFICWRLRDALRTNRIANTTPQKAGEVVAMLGMLLFLVTLLSDGILPALITVLFALLAATIVIAERRAHVLLLLGASLAPVLFAASQSRSALFVPCAAWFTLAMLSLLTFDIAMARRQSAAATPIDERRTGHGAAVVAFIVLAFALPLYLYVPQPPALALGGRSAQSANDYSDPEYRPDAKSSRHSNSADKRGGADAPAADRKPEPDATDPAHTGDHANGEPAGQRDKDSFGISDVARSSALGERIVMYVKTSHPLYLRGKLYDHFEGDRWSRSDESVTRFTLDSGYLRLGPASNAGTHVEQTISVVADLGTSLYASPAISQIRFPGPLLLQHADGTFDVPRPLRAETSYSIDAEPRIFDGRYAVDGAEPDRRYLQIDAKVSARVKKLAESVTANAADPWHRALALEGHLRDHYAYSYETIVPYQGYTPIDWFLFENRRGHCEFFASAMAVMLREIGIPSRLANGYSLGERNPLTGFHEVRAFDGHAWVEGWFADRGWVMFEPTPFYPLPQERPDGQVASAADRYLERQVETSEMLAPESLHALLAQVFRDSWAALRNLQRTVTAFVERVLPWLPFLAFLGIFVWAAVRMATLALRDGNERRAISRLLAAARLNPDDALLKLADALERALSSRRLPRNAHATWREYCVYLAEREVELPQDFAEKFDDARYGSICSAPARESIRTLEATIAAAISADRYPRLACQLRTWRNLTGGWIRASGNPR